METNAGGLREGEGGKAGALLLPAAQVSKSIVIIIINNITTIIATINLFFPSTCSYFSYFDIFVL